MTLVVVCHYIALTYHVLNSCCHPIKLREMSPPPPGATAAVVKCEMAAHQGARSQSCGLKDVRWLNGQVVEVFPAKSIAVISDRP